MKEYINGLKKAIETIEVEYEMCVMEIGDSEDENVKKMLRYTKTAFCRLTGLIEDEMIQCGETFSKNFYVDKIANLEDIAHFDNNVN